MKKLFTVLALVAFGSLTQATEEDLKENKNLHGSAVVSTASEQEVDVVEEEEQQEEGMPPIAYSPMANRVLTTLGAVCLVTHSTLKQAGLDQDGVSNVVDFSAGVGLSCAILYGQLNRFVKVSDEAKAMAGTQLSYWTKMGPVAQMAAIGLMDLAIAFGLSGSINPTHMCGDQSVCISKQMGYVTLLFTVILFVKMTYYHLLMSFTNR